MCRPPVPRRCRRLHHRRSPQLNPWLLDTIDRPSPANPTTPPPKPRPPHRLHCTGVIVGLLVPTSTPPVETKLRIVIASTTLFHDLHLQIQFLHLFITIRLWIQPLPAGLDVYAAMPVRIIDTIIGDPFALGGSQLPVATTEILTLERTAALAVCSNGAYLENHRTPSKRRTGGRRRIPRHPPPRPRTQRRPQQHSFRHEQRTRKFADSLCKSGLLLPKPTTPWLGYISALGAYQLRIAEQGECRLNLPHKYRRPPNSSGRIFPHLPESASRTTSASLFGYTALCSRPCPQNPTASGFITVYGWFEPFASSSSGCIVAFITAPALCYSHQGTVLNVSLMSFAFCAESWLSDGLPV